MRCAKRPALQPARAEKETATILSGCIKWSQALEIQAGHVRPRRKDSGQLYSSSFGHSGVAASNAVNYARFFSRSHDAVIRVYDEAGNVIATHKHAGDFKEP
jgi:hypothetical protein